MRIKAIEVTVIHRNVTAEVTAHYTVVHLSVSDDLAGFLILILNEILEVKIDTIVCGNIIATHLVTNVSLFITGSALIEAIRLMSLHATVGHKRVVAAIEREESYVRNAVRLICTPEIDNTVTVSVDLDGHILTLDAMHDIMHSGVRSLHANASAIVAIMILVIGINRLRIRNDSLDSTVSDRNRSIIRRIHSNLGYAEEIVLYRCGGINVTLLVNEYHLVFVYATVSVLAVTKSTVLLLRAARVRTTPLSSAPAPSFPALRSRLQATRSVMSST